ncbi:cyclase family protein [Frankia sp. CNm7]|uniref:Cyclase family protein n=1 Tax=Frankia nepalensis TaxID=1836974 RepID=A0A937UPU4_9ACTN|nr:cyclase family protein [Frankia nepalensis]MBL7510533.1 cyclase family protein [Frankia nepalensis]MBL7521277.1 cyclase family protein [Frankia nepalensis]MBL7629492.1 cyclase family protein [Frankia nepalensis]
MALAGWPAAPVRPVLLAHVHDPATTPLFPGDPPFTMTTAASIDVDGYYLRRVCSGEHTGTHWGAPAHFEAGGAAADELTADDLFLPAVRLDVRAAAARDPDYQVTVADLAAFEDAHGPIPPGAAVLAWTGWSDRWGTPAYANLDSAGRIHQPGFALAAVEWLLETGRLGRRGALGTDTFGPDPGLDTSYAVSRALYGQRRISLENLTNLGALPAVGAWVLVGGTRNRAGSGSPATVYGLLPAVRATGAGPGPAKAAASSGPSAASGAGRANR